MTDEGAAATPSAPPAKRGAGRPKVDKCTNCRACKCKCDGSHKGCERRQVNETAAAGSHAPSSAATEPTQAESAAEAAALSPRPTQRWVRSAAEKFSPQVSMRDQTLPDKTLQRRRKQRAQPRAAGEEGDESQGESEGEAHAEGEGDESKGESEGEAHAEQMELEASRQEESVEDEVGSGEQSGEAQGGSASHGPEGQGGAMQGRRDRTGTAPTDCHGTADQRLHCK